MKIHNIEDGTKKIYVQRKDIKKLLDFERTIPMSIVNKYFSDICSFDLKENDNEFVIFTEQFEIEYFENLDWIIDYREFKDFSDKELLEIESLLVNEQKAIAKNHNETPIYDNSIRERLLLKHKSYYYKIASLREIIKIKQGELPIPFPEVPDYKGFIINKDGKFIAQQGLNPLQFFIYKKDGSTLVKETITEEFYLSVFGKAIEYNMSKNEHFNNFLLEKKLSKDFKSLITTFKIIPKSKEQDDTLENANSVSLGKRIAQRIFKSKK